MLVLLLPRFVDTQSAVMVNLRTLECQELNFSTRLRLADEAAALADEAAVEDGGEDNEEDDTLSDYEPPQAPLTPPATSKAKPDDHMADIDMDSPVDSQKVLVSSPNKEGMDLS